MGKLTFHAFKELCELNLSKKYVPELFEIITNSDCLFHPGTVMPQDDIASLYKLRLEHAKESGRSADDYINDFEETVSNLLASKSSDLGITWLRTEQNSFLIFYDPIPPNILGVLKAKSSQGLQSIEEQKTDTVIQGRSSGDQKYSKGELVKEWK